MKTLVENVEIALMSSVQNGTLHVIKKLEGQIRTVYSFELGAPYDEGEAVAALENTLQIPGVVVECNRELSL